MYGRPVLFQIYSFFISGPATNQYCLSYILQELFNASYQAAWGTNNLLIHNPFQRLSIIAYMSEEKLVDTAIRGAGV